MEKCDQGINCAVGGGVCGLGVNCASATNAQESTHRFETSVGNCGRAYNCGGGGGECGRAHDCSGGGGVCGRAYACTGN